MHPSSVPNLLFIGAVAVLVVLLVLRLLRGGALREKYAALWVLIGLAVVVLAVFPGLLDGAARVLGFEVASNLLLLLAIVLLLGVTLHLSMELSRRKDEARVLAEEAAIARLVVERHERRLDALESRSISSLGTEQVIDPEPVRS